MIAEVSTAIDRLTALRARRLAEDERLVCWERAQALHAARSRYGDPRDAGGVLEAHDGHVSLLLTDVVMPGMNGRELYDQLALSHPRLRVLYASGYTGNAIVHRGVLDPGIPFISKPFTLVQLARKVREVLDGR